MTHRRVVITGLGIVAPNGIGKQQFWKNLVAGESAVDRVFAFDASKYPCQIASEVRDFSATDYMAPQTAKAMGRFSQLAVASAQLAVDDSRITITPSLSESVGIASGTALAGVTDVAGDIYRGFFSEGLLGIPDGALVEYPAHAATVHIATELGIQGPAMTISTNCCSGLDSIYAAYAQIKLGNARVCLASGSDAPIFPTAFASFCRFGVLTQRNNNPRAASRPFDRLRDGIVAAEGAGTIVLEELDSALERGAKIYAEVLGYGSATETGGPLRLATGRAMARAITTALTNAELPATAIDHINAHGCALSHQDVCDTNAFKHVFGTRAYNVPITSIKSMIGQPFAAAGLLQTAAACLSLEHQLLPPTINQEVRDPRCDLDYVPNVSRAAKLNRVLINTQGTGGSCAALVIGRRDRAMTSL